MSDLAKLHALGSCRRTWPHEEVCTDLRAEELRVCDLKPGDVVSLSLPQFPPATFIAASAHPIHIGLRLVVWWIPANPVQLGRFSFDALALGQRVGKRVEMPFKERIENLEKSMRGES